jgi:hypothetical protein
VRFVAAVNAIQSAAVDAVHRHVAPMETAIVDVVASARRLREAGESVAAQLTSAWLTVTVWPATVTVPVRAAPLLEPIVSDTFPAPFPEAPDVTWIQLS